MNEAAPSQPRTHLTELPHEEIGALASLLPDTPWTTTPIQACERHLARAWVDVHDEPRSVVVLLPADEAAGRPARAHVFGSDGSADALVSWASEQTRPIDVVCDDDVGLALFAAHPEAQVADSSVHWFERLDAVDRPETSSVRRLRLRDVAAVEQLAPADLLTAFESLKDLLMVGGASGVVEEGRLISAAFTVDQSVNYARICAFTAPDRRRQGLAEAACRHLVAAHHEQGRLACALVPGGDPAGEALSRAIGFESAARIRRYRLS